MRQPCVRETHALQTQEQLSHIKQTNKQINKKCVKVPGIGTCSWESGSDSAGLFGEQWERRRGSFRIIRISKAVSLQMGCEMVPIPAAQRPSSGFNLRFNSVGEGGLLNEWKRLGDDKLR